SRHQNRRTRVDASASHAPPGVPALYGSRCRRGAAPAAHAETFTITHAHAHTHAVTHAGAPDARHVRRGLHRNVRLRSSALPTYNLPPDTRAVGTGNPPADMNSVVHVLNHTVLQRPFYIHQYGADPTGATL